MGRPQEEFESGVSYPKSRRRGGAATAILRSPRASESGERASQAFPPEAKTCGGDTHFTVIEIFPDTTGGLNG